MSRQKKPSKEERQLHAWKKWESAAARFQGVAPWLQAKSDLRHISLTRSGYQIRIHRGGKRVFDRCVGGRGEESLLEAVRMRDEALRRWPTRGRTNAIPPAVLEALGLSEPVVGINRLPSRSSYRVYYERGGRRYLEQFYYRVVPEEVAYAAAIDFIQRHLQK